jgi:hypothetical protein
MTREAIEVANRIRDAPAVPLEIAGRTVSVGASIGVALRDRAEIDAVTLVYRAGLAMYRAKHDGKGGVACFDAGMPLASPDPPADAAGGAGRMRDAAAIRFACLKSGGPPSAVS